MTPSKLAHLILEAKTLEDLQQKVRAAVIKERLMPFDQTVEDRINLHKALPTLPQGPN